jgi:Gpi18-like mannosyltransferase
MLIAEHGYGPSVPRGPALAAYFPLYPLLMHLIAPTATHYALEIPALVVSNLALLGALMAVGQLAAYERRDARAALVPMLLLAASPLAVFLTDMYADGLFLALAAWALLAARRGAWTWAAVAAALAVVARPYGLALMPALVVEYAGQHAWAWRLRVGVFTLPSLATVRQVALIGLMPAATLGAFLLVIWHQYGSRWPSSTLRSTHCR